MNLGVTEDCWKLLSITSMPPFWSRELTTSQPDLQSFGQALQQFICLTRVGTHFHRTCRAGSCHPSHTQPCLKLLGRFVSNLCQVAYRRVPLLSGCPCLWVVCWSSLHWVTWGFQEPRESHALQCSWDTSMACKSKGGWKSSQWWICDLFTEFVLPTKERISPMNKHWAGLGALTKVAPVN